MFHFTMLAFTKKAGIINSKAMKKLKDIAFILVWAIIIVAFIYFGVAIIIGFIREPEF